MSFPKRALGKIDLIMKPETRKSYCRFCLSFCGIKVEFDSQMQPMRISGDSEHPISKGYTCKKGRSLLDFYAANRLLQPMKFGSETMTWEQAFASLGETIHQVVRNHGPDAVALYTGTNATLDAAGIWTALGFMYRLESKSIYSVTSIDAINKQVVIENLTSYATLGLIPQVDFAGTDCLLIVGANPIVSHGHLGGMPYPGKRLRDILKRDGKVIVADPRMTRTAKIASFHLRPKPGTDYAWLGFVIRELLADGAADGIDRDYLQQHANGIEQIARITNQFDAALTTRITGLDAQALGDIAAMIKKAAHVSALTGTGASFSDAGIVTEWFVWVLLAIKGKLDRPGGVWFNPGVAGQIGTVQARGGTAWDMRVPSRPDLPARQGERPVAGLADEVISGNVRVLICLGGNPINAFPNSSKTMAALAGLEALVVLDTHNNELVRLAHYGLPVSGQLERADSSIYTQNSAPVISVALTDRVVPPPGQAKPAWWVFSNLGEQLGLDTVKLGKRTEQLNDFDVLKTIKGARELFDGQKALLEEGIHVAKESLFGWVIDNVLPNKRWRLHSDTLASELTRVLAQADVNGNAMRLVSMREDDHLNTQFMLDHEDHSTPRAIICDADAAQFQLRQGDRVKLTTGAGSMQALIDISADAGKNTVCVPHGYAGRGNVSNLTSEKAGINPLSGMVSQTAICVSIEKLAPA